MLSSHYFCEVFQLFCWRLGSLVSLPRFNFAPKFCWTCKNENVSVHKYILYCLLLAAAIIHIHWVTACSACSGLNLKWTLNCFVTAAKTTSAKDFLPFAIDCLTRCCLYSVTDPNLDMNDVICVELLKTSAGLGFSLDGGKASIAGDRPLLVKRIFKGTTSMQWMLSQFFFCALRRHFNCWGIFVCFGLVFFF